MNLHSWYTRVTALCVIATTVALQATDSTNPAPTTVVPTSATPTAPDLSKNGLNPKEPVLKKPETAKAPQTAPAQETATPSKTPQTVALPTGLFSNNSPVEAGVVSVGYNQASNSVRDWFFPKKQTIEPLLPCNIHSVPGMVGAIPEKIFWFIEQLKKSDITNPDALFQRRLILYGPPGNGKTTLAMVIAREADCQLISVKGSRIITTYQGQGSQSIEETFARAAKLSTETGRPVVIFFDEIDAIARENTLETRGEQQAALQTLWLCLDEYKDDPRICVICATNHFYRLDKTFLDRFGINTVEIGHPDAESRKAVIEFYMQQHHLAFAPELVKDLVSKTSGYSIRSIEGVISTLASSLSRRVNKVLSAQDLDTVIAYNNARDINKQHGEEDATPFYEGFKGHLQKFCDKLYYWTNWPKVESLMQKFLLVTNVALNAHHVSQLSKGQ